MISPDSPHVVILGAGVIGMTTAYVLATRHPSYKITIVARELPVESDLTLQTWASPWAVSVVWHKFRRKSDDGVQGADWSPIGDYNERKYRMESKTL